LQGGDCYKDKPETQFLGFMPKKQTAPQTLLQFLG
jgi:hypothetical protein